MKCLIIKQNSLTSVSDFLIGPVKLEKFGNVINYSTVSHIRVCYKQGE